MSLFQVKGKYLFKEDKKFTVKGIAYSPFAPEDYGGAHFPSDGQMAADLDQIAATGANCVRLYQKPPESFMSLCQERGIEVILGIHINVWENFLGREEQGRYVKVVADLANFASRWDNAPILSLGNEIPQDTLREMGIGKVERFLARLNSAVKSANPDVLTTFGAFPPTEFLELPFLDLYSFNIYIYQKAGFRAYIHRLQNRLGNKPLLLGEIGADSLREGAHWQAGLLKWKIRAAMESGCCGTIVFTYCDGWWDGMKVTDWRMGLVQEDRAPKPAYFVVREEFKKNHPSADDRPVKASVVVCAYNESGYIARCLDSLLNLNYPNKEIIVVDDGSSDGTGDIAGQFPVTVIRQENQGLSVARNTGFQAASGDIVAYIDADCEADADWLGHLVSLYDSEKVGAAGGPNLTPKDDPFVAQAVGRAPGAATHVLVEDTLAEHVPGCNMSFRRSALERIGGFDPRFRIAGDDLDAGWRLQDAGYEIRFHPAAQVFHHRRNSARAYLRQQYNYGLAEALIRQTHPERYSRLGAKWQGRIYGAVPKLFIELFKRPMIYFQPFPKIYDAYYSHLAFYLPLSFPWYAAGAALLPFAFFAGEAFALWLLLFGAAATASASIGWWETRGVRRDRLKLACLVAMLSFCYQGARGWGQVKGAWRLRFRGPAYGANDAHKISSTLNRRMQPAEPPASSSAA